MKGELLSYRPRLDGLRLVAISLVLIHHFGGYLASFFDAGYYGVDLFFVLSGYLITSILLKDSRDSFGEVYRGFIGRRALRIFPAYYLLLFVLVLINFPTARSEILYLLSYTFNYKAALIQASGKENPLYYLWSLSVEEQFYLLWPPVVIALRSRKPILLGAVFTIVVVGYLQLTINLVPAFAPYNYTGLFNRMGSLGLGAFGAIYASWKPLPASIFRTAWAEIAAFAILAVSLGMDISLRFPILGLISLFFVLKAAHFDFRLKTIDRFLQRRPVVYVGAISYGIYLYHVPVGALLSQHVFDPFWASIPFENLGWFAKARWHSWILKLPFYSGLTIAVAAASFRWFESPILSLKYRWFNYRTSEIAPIGN